jgi:hypothetical protein
MRSDGQPSRGSGGDALSGPGAARGRQPGAAGREPEQADDERDRSQRVVGGRFSTTVRVVAGVAACVAAGSGPGPASPPATSCSTPPLAVTSIVGAGWSEPAPPIQRATWPLL